MLALSIRSRSSSNGTWFAVYRVSLSGPYLSSTRPSATWTGTELFRACARAKCTYVLPNGLAIATEPALVGLFVNGLLTDSVAVRAPNDVCSDLASFDRVGWVGASTRRIYRNS